VSHTPRTNEDCHEVQCPHTEIIGGLLFLTEYLLLYVAASRTEPSGETLMLDNLISSASKSDLPDGAKALLFDMVKRSESTIAKLLAELR
jgi:hypothetical protein